MLNADDLAEAEGTADWILRSARVDPDAPISAWTIAKRVLGRRPEHARMLAQGKLIRVEDERRIYLRHRLSPAREELVIAHELAHWARPEREETAHEEAMCDAIAARVLAPRVAVRRIVRHIGHRVHSLAKLLHTEQSVALLRIGEVTGRPVLLFRAAGVIVRGDDFEWGRHPRTLPRELAHPIRVEQRLGMMAKMREAA